MAPLIDGLFEKTAELTAAAHPNQYDTLYFRMDATPAARSLLMAQPGGFYAAAWSEKRIPVNIELSHACLRAVSRPYHTLLFDSTLKDLVRHGIPASMRPTMWFWLSGGYALQLSAPEGLFNKLSASIDGVDDVTINSIEEGVDSICQTYKGHNFQQNLVLQTGKGSEALTHVMYAVLQHCKDLKYSRALHQLAAFVTVVFGAHRSEHAFWTLVGLIQTKLFPYVHGEVTHGNFVEKGVLELLVQRKLPKLSAHLAKKGWTLAAITHGWFSTIFTSNVQPEVAARMWDAIMSEGSKVMHRIALALLKRCEAALTSALDQDMARRILELRLLEIADKDELMKAAFNSVGSLPASLLTTFRTQVLAGSAFAEYKQLHAATDDMHFEASPIFTVISVLQPAVGLKGLLGRGVARMSHGSEDGAGGPPTGSVESCSGYCSDGDGDGSDVPFSAHKRKKSARSRHVHWDESSDAPSPGTECTEPSTPLEASRFARVSLLDPEAGADEVAACAGLDALLDEGRFEEGCGSPVAADGPDHGIAADEPDTAVTSIHGVQNMIPHSAVHAVEAS